jgi:hypothetical protein
MSDGLFEQVLTFPDPDAQRRYSGLVGVDATKERLEKEAEAMLRPDLLEKWSKEKHDQHIVALGHALGARTSLHLCGRWQDRRNQRIPACLRRRRRSVEEMQGTGQR